MTVRTSRRGFVALASGVLGGFATGLGRAFGHAPAGRPAVQLDTDVGEARPNALSVTTYTYDKEARLLAVTRQTP